MIQEHEMILKIMEEEGKPLQARNISSLIYKFFDGYKIHRTKVRNYLWEKETLKYLVSYTKENYTYELKSNHEQLRELIQDDDSIFNFKVKSINKINNDNNIFNYKIVGKEVVIEHSLKAENIEHILIGLIKTQIEISDNKHIFNKIKVNISKVIDDFR